MRIQRKLVKMNKARPNSKPVAKKSSTSQSVHNTSYNVKTKYANPHNFVNRKMNIGMLVVATGKYIDFINPLLEGARKYFLSNHNVTFHIFTNNPTAPINGSNIKTYHVPHKEWPYPTLLRYHMFTQYKKELLEEDYLFYSDVDMSFVDNVQEEILGERVATIHPGYFGGRGDPESDPRSTSCIKPDEKVVYFAGGFNGGSSKEFIRMSEKISSNVDEDLENDIIARWHDESHLNRYFLNYKPTVILDPGYCYSLCSGHMLPYARKILALDKDHGFYRG